MSSVLNRPALAIAIDGVPLPRAFAATAGHAVVQQVLGVPAIAEIDFADAGSALPEALAIGGTIALRVAEEALFEGRIAALTWVHDGTGGQVLRLRAHDALHAARKRRAMALRENASAATLGAEIAGRLGLEFRCLASPPTRSLLFQTGQSDLDLLVRLAEEDGLYPVLAAGTLSLVTLEGGGTPVVLRLGRSLHQLTISRSDESAIGQAETLGWRSDTLEALREAAQANPPGGALPAGEDAVRLLPDRMAGGAQQLRSLSRAAMERARAASVTAEGVLDGNPGLAPGRQILVEAPRPEQGGEFVVTRAVHRFTAAAGYLTEFATAPPPSRERERRAVVTFGRVSDTGDPEEAGRCRVSLPGFADLQSGWLQVVAPGAGKGRGLACLPESRDAVLVVLPDGDPAHGFVLGGLWGGERLPRGAGRRQKRPFVLRTAGGQGLELGQDAALARLSTAAGSVVELAPGRLRIAAASDLVIEAPGRSVTIRAGAINFEQA